MSYNDKDRKITSIDVHNFDINIEALLDCKHAFRFFVQYLRETCNGENANFLIDAQEFRDIRYDKKRQEKAKYIYDMYIKEDSPYELNINATIREEVLSNLGGHCRKLMFDNVEHKIVIGLNEHVFPLFLKSKLFEKFIELNTLNTLYEIGTVRKNSLLYYIDGLTELREPTVVSTDVNFIETQVKDSDVGWELIGRSDHHSCWYSKDTYNIGDSNRLNFFKYYVTIDFDINTVFNTFKELDYRKILDKNLVNITNVTYLVPNIPGGLYTSITSEEYKLTYPFKNREFIVSTSGIRRDNKIIIVMKTSDYPVPYKDKVIRCPSIGGWVFENIGEGKTKYCQFHYIDFKGKVPKGIMKILLKSRAKQFYSKSKEAITKFVGTRYITLQDNEIGKTISDNRTLL
jgi:hypothetical protein